MFRDARYTFLLSLRQFCLLIAALPAFAGTDVPPQLSPYDQRRQEFIAEFTAKQEAANWPQKFESIGNDMGVPPDVLASVAFTETRWEQLIWPPGETVSPETGRPHPYGVMSLWDNDVLGHSLVDAAALIGSTTDALKADPNLNIRGAAALLKKYYDENPLPEGTTPQDIESWQNAIVKYCGIKDPYLAYHHVFNCYLAMSQGYDDFGMHWKPHPVNLAPMRVKVKELRVACDATRTAGTLVPHPAPLSVSPPPTPDRPAAMPQVPAALPVASVVNSSARPVAWLGWLSAATVLGLLGITLFYRRRCSQTVEIAAAQPLKASATTGSSRRD